MTDRGDNHPHSGRKGIYLGPVAFEMRLGVPRVETHQQGSGVNRKYPHRQFLPLLATRGGGIWSIYFCNVLLTKGDVRDMNQATAHR